jgi:hypothetical protein
MRETMADSQPFQEDLVEAFLDSPLPTAVTAELRQTIRERTTRLLRRRRRLKRAGYVLGLVGCYLLGLGTMRLWTATPSATTATVRLSPGGQSMPDTPAPTPARSAQRPNENREVPAFVLERMAQSSEEHRADLYRRAGDGYLANGEFESAVFCYGRSLDAGSEKDWRVTKDDNWLLMQLKTARQEEKVYAKVTG